MVKLQDISFFCYFNAGSRKLLDISIKVWGQGWSLTAAMAKSVERARAPHCLCCYYLHLTGKAGQVVSQGWGHWGKVGAESLTFLYSPTKFCTGFLAAKLHHTDTHAHILPHTHCYCYCSRLAHPSDPHPGPPGQGPSGSTPRYQGGIDHPPTRMYSRPIPLSTHATGYGGTTVWLWATRRPPLAPVPYLKADRVLTLITLATPPPPWHPLGYSWGGYHPTHPCSHTHTYTLAHTYPDTHPYTHTLPHTHTTNTRWQNIGKIY